MKKKVLIFSIAYEPHIGGAELAVRNITDRLPRSRALGRSKSFYEFDLITARFSPSHPKSQKIGNVNVHRVGFGSRLGRYLYPFLASRKAKKLHKQRKYDLIWSIMAAYAGAAALMFLNRYPKVPLLLTLQEGDSVEHIHGKVRHFKSAWREVFTRANYIQAISNFLADWARDEGAVCPVEVVPNGVDLEKFNPNRQSQIANRFTVITTSRLVYKNGIDVLIKAISVIASKAKQSQQDRSGLRPRDDIRLQVLGSGPDETKLKELAKEGGVENLVEFLGHIEPDKLPDYLASADIFVRPSRSEGLGISFLEAMAAGLPVIATKVGGIPDFLTDRETGLFSKQEDPVDLAEKIELLLRDDKLREKLVVQGRELMEKKYSWDRVAEQMGEIFAKL